MNPGILEIHLPPPCVGEDSDSSDSNSRVENLSTAKGAARPTCTWDLAWSSMVS